MAAASGREVGPAFQPARPRLATSSALNCRAIVKGSFNVVELVATRPIRSVPRAIDVSTTSGSMA